MLILGAVVGLATVIIGNGTVSAHAELVTSSPAADSIVQVAPTEIVLTFGESVDAVPDSIRVVTGAGGAVDIGDISGDGSTALSADLPALDQGSYVVAWRAVSEDSHPISGAFVFSVGVQTSTDPGLVDEILADAQPADGSERWLAAGRATSYLGVTASVGAVAVLSMLAPMLIGQRRTRTLLLTSLSIGAIGTVLMIAAHASIALNDVWAWRERGPLERGKVVVRSPGRHRDRDRWCCSARGALRNDGGRRASHSPGHRSAGRRHSRGPWHQWPSRVAGVCSHGGASRGVVGVVRVGWWRWPRRCRDRT